MFNRVFNLIIDIFKQGGNLEVKHRQTEGRKPLEEVAMMQLQAQL